MDTNSENNGCSNSGMITASVFAIKMVIGIEFIFEVSINYKRLYMDEKQKEKMAELKKQMQAKMQDKILQNNVLFQESLTALSDYLIIEDNSEVERITDIASSKDAEMHSHDELIELNDEEHYYIVWDDLSVPIVESSGLCIKNSWDYVMAVSFDTYFVSKLSERVIGIRH